MAKWIKKNSRYILIAFAIMIMIVFILPQQMLQPSGGSQKVFEVNGRKVTGAEYRDASGAVEKAKRALGENAGMIFDRDIGGSSRVDPAERFYLMAEEARRGGFIGAAGDSSTMVNQITRSQLEQELRSLIANGRLKFPQTKPDGSPMDQAGMMAWYNEKLAEAEAAAAANIKSLENQYASEAHEKTGQDVLSEYVGIIRMLNQDAQSLKPSLPRLLSAAKRDLDSATIQYVFVPVDEAAAKARPTPSDADLQAFFDKYKNTMTGTGEQGIGYRQPNRIAVQWLTIDREAIAKGVKPNPIEVQKELMKGVSVGGDDSARRAAIEADLVRKGTDNAVNLAKDAAKRLILQTISKLPDEGSYKALGADFKPVDLAKIGQGVVEELRAKGVEINMLPIRTSDALMSRDDLRKHPELGQMYLVRGSVAANLVDPFRSVPPILDDIREFKPSAPRVAIQQGIPLVESLINANTGNAVYICVTKASPEASPASLADVREQVIVDKKKVDHFEELKKLAPGYALSASELGMTQLVEMLKKTNPSAELKQGVKLSRRGGLSPADTAIDARETIESVMDRAAKLDPTVPFDQTNAIVRTLSIPMPSKLGVVIAQITAYDPLTRERFRELASQELESAVGQEARKLSADSSFRHATLAKRLKLEGTKPAKKDASTTTTTPDPANDQ